MKFSIYLNRHVFVMWMMGLSVTVYHFLQEFLDDGNGRVCGIKTYLVEWKKNEMGRWEMQEIPGD